MSRKTNLLVGIACVVLIVALVLWHVHERDAHAGDNHVAPRAQVVTVAHGSIESSLTVAGIFQPYQEIDVHGKVSGYIRNIYVDIGDKVHKGQTLAILEVPELDAEVAGADAGVLHSRDQITLAESEVARAIADHNAVHAAYARLKQASEKQPGLIAQQELDDAEARDLATAAQVKVAQAGLSASRQKLGMSQADRMRVQALKDYSVVTAPYNGVITMRYADTGALIPAGTAETTDAKSIVRLAQSDLLRLRMPVPENDVPYIHDGDQVDVHIQATGQTIKGTVVRYTRQVTFQTRTMLTEVDIPNPDLSLTPGMYAETTFHLQHKNDAIVIPSAAVIPGDHPNVLVVDSESRIQHRPVTLGIQTANRVEVISGLNAGEHVVVGSLGTYQQNEKVTPQPATMDLVNYNANAEEQ